MALERFNIYWTPSSSTARTAYTFTLSLYIVWLHSLSAKSIEAHGRRERLADLWHEDHIMILTFSVAFYLIAMEFGLRLVNIMAYWHFKKGNMMAFLHDTNGLGHLAGLVAWKGMVGSYSDPDRTVCTLALRFTGILIRRRGRVDGTGISIFVQRPAR